MKIRLTVRLPISSDTDCCSSQRRKISLRATSIQEPAHRVHTSEYVAGKLERRAERTKDRDDRDGLAVDRVQMQPHDRVCPMATRPYFSQSQNPAPRLNKPTNPICACPRTSGRTPVSSHKSAVSACRPAIDINDPTLAAGFGPSMSTIIKNTRHQGDAPLQYRDPSSTAEMKSGRPPTMLIVTSVMNGDSPNMILQPKLSDRLPSIPATETTQKTRRHSRHAHPPHLQSPVQTCSTDGRGRRCRGNGWSQTARSPKAPLRMPSAEQNHTVRWIPNPFVQHGQGMDRSAT